VNSGADGVTACCSRNSANSERTGRTTPRKTITSYDDPAVGRGNVVNEIKFVYNDFGQLIDDYQSHSGAVNAMSTLRIPSDFKSCVPFVSFVSPFDRLFIMSVLMWIIIIVLR
jgi:hypothetical protein